MNWQGQRSGANRQAQLGILVAEALQFLVHHAFTGAPGLLLHGSKDLSEPVSPAALSVRNGFQVDGLMKAINPALSGKLGRDAMVATQSPEAGVGMVTVAVRDNGGVGWSHYVSHGNISFLRHRGLTRGCARLWRHRGGERGWHGR